MNVELLIPTAKPVCQSSRWSQRSREQRVLQSEPELQPGLQGPELFSGTAWALHLTWSSPTFHLQATGNLSEKAQVAGGQARGPEANGLLTLEHAGSGTPAQTRDDAAEATTSHPCPVLELPPAWPLGCGTEDVPAFCFICFHKEEEEELLEEVPLQRCPRDQQLPLPGNHIIPGAMEKMSVGCPEPEPPHSLPCCGPGTAPGLGAGVPLLTEDMQALTLRTLAASDVTKHYELVRELGKGTYGKVDLVAYKGTGTKMALKFVNKSKTKLKNFLREVSITNSLSSSPFIIKVFDVVFETEDCYVFAQEYAPAGDLFDIIPPQAQSSSQSSQPQSRLSALGFLAGREVASTGVWV
ncbi:hypothetical protein CB1_000645002 [Camelus ferus]|nr:hypothetical protein CB1_000645002 [Camelus ferus]